MPDDRKRVTVRLPQDAYDQLCAELSSFSTDTARFQFVVQFYLDYKAQGATPTPPPSWRDECNQGDATDNPSDNTTDNSSANTPDAPTIESRSVTQEPSQRDGRHHRRPSPSKNEGPQQEGESYGDDW
jgi:hypothetical protein